MTVTSVEKDPVARTLTLTADFAADQKAVWALWENPRHLERWWGPPTYPATVVEHDLAPGATVRYYMTGPEGDRHHGYWTVTEVNPPNRLVFDDGFADEQGRPATDMPVTRTVVTLAGRPDGGTRMVLRSTFESAEDMEKLLAMGMEEGMKLAVGQADALLP
jgi:uncharacterized protein YndB with AHSA1/START domain